METFSALLALCAGNSPVTREFPTQRPVTRSFDVFFGLRLNKRLSKQSLIWDAIAPIMTPQQWYRLEGWQPPAHYTSATSFMERYRCDKTNPAINVIENGGLTTIASWPPPNLICLIILITNVHVTLHFYHVQLSCHGGCRWPGAYLAPGHYQPSWWRRPVLYEECPSITHLPLVPHICVSESGQR